MTQSSTERFSNRVSNYIKYRPTYPAAVLDLFRREMGLTAASTIADIGSGTGISAKFFLDNGNTVIGVEPNQAMRRAAESFLRDFPKFKSVAGTSDHTGLPTGSVDFVVAAQAFHWFDPESARVEFHRILKKAGYTALIWNERQLDSNDFLREYERFIVGYATDYEAVRHENISNDIIGEFFQNTFQKMVFQNSQVLDFEGLRGRLLSSSYIPTEENPRFEEMIGGLNGLFSKYQKDDKVEIIYDTKVYYGRF